MPFTIDVKINGNDKVTVFCRNWGAPEGQDRSETQTRVYKYEAEHPETGKVTKGEVLHERDEGIEKLTALIFADLAAKVNSFKPGA